MMITEGLTPQDPLTIYEHRWNAKRDAWTLEMWRKAAEGLSLLVGENVDRLLAPQNPKPKRRRGRPPAPLSLVAILYPKGGGKVGRRQRDSNDAYESLIASVNHQRKLIERETGRRATDKAAIQRWIRNNTGMAKRSDHAIRKEVSRLQKLLSRAKLAVAK